MLKNHPYPRSDLLQIAIGDLDSINFNNATSGIHKTIDGPKEGRLSGTTGSEDDGKTSFRRGEADPIYSCRPIRESFGNIRKLDQRVTSRFGQWHE